MCVCVSPFALRPTIEKVLVSLWSPFNFLGFRCVGMRIEVEGGQVKGYPDVYIHNVMGMGRGASDLSRCSSDREGFEIMFVWLSFVVGLDMHFVYLFSV